MYTFVIIGFKWKKDPNIKFLSEEYVRSKLWHNMYSGYVRFKTTAVSLSMRWLHIALLCPLEPIQVSANEHSSENKARFTHTAQDATQCYWLQYVCVFFYFFKQWLAVCLFSEPQIESFHPETILLQYPPSTETEPDRYTAGVCAQIPTSMYHVNSSSASLADTAG